jgi:sugar lactone lactonase YvrE
LSCGVSILSLPFKNTEIPFKVMNVNLRKFTLLFTACLFACPFARSAEQDNWYIAWEASVPSCNGVAYHVDSTTGVGQIYVTSTSSDDVKVYDLNGSLDRSLDPISSAKYNVYDLAIDEDGTLFVADEYWITSMDSDGSINWRVGGYGSEDLKFNYAYGITIGQDGNLYVADHSNHRVQVLDKNGSFIRKFGENGSAPGQLNGPLDIASLPDGRMVVGDQSYLHYFQPDGTFLKRENQGNNYVSVGPDGTLFSRGKLLDSEGGQITYISNLQYNSRTCFTPEGDLIESYNSKLRLWKRAFRTKGLPERNVIAQPAIREVSQRAGTNIIDIKVEIIDADDDNATLGILAAIDGEFNNPNKWIIPQGWVDYSENQIGSPISTNVVHTFSWDVKQDWAEQTGSLEFEVFSQTGSRTKPIDVHYLTLPLGDGNLTISRSPIKDAEMVNYLKYLLVSGQGGLSLSAGKIVDGNGVALVEVSGSSLHATAEGRALFMDALGHRWAKLLEVTMAREAATPGTINQWSANRQIEPRDLPNQVNEYGFDVGSHGSRAWWVVKNSTLPRRDFNSTIFDNNGSENEYFGRMVAVDGNLMAVRGDTGSYNGQADQKKIYIYEVSAESNALTLKFIVQPDDVSSSTSDGFGRSFALKNGQLLVGAHMADIPGAGNTNAGAAYLFEVNGSSPTQVARFMSSDLFNDDVFGISVDLDSNLMVVGAYADDINGYQNSGSAYVFRRESNGTITELAKLSAPDGRADDRFGYSVAVDGNHIAIGAYLADAERDGSSQIDSGKVYLYKVGEDGNVTYVETLVAPYPHNSTYFGYSLSISEGFLAVGQYNTQYYQDGSYQRNSYYQGSVCLYQLSDAQPARLTSYIQSPVPIQEGYFGYSVDLEGNRLVVGAKQEDAEAANDTGAAYLFEISEDGKPSLVERFTHPAGKASDQFGVSVGVSGRNIVVGADFFDLPNERWNAGQAIFYRESE